ncbi:MAG: hypothetical protein ABIX46_09590 [Burkholderiaceae bacterium]
MKRALIATAGLVWACMGPAAEAVAQAGERGARERLQQERSAIDARFEGRERSCGDLPVAKACLDAARRDRRTALVPLRREDAALDAEQRRRRAAEREAARLAKSAIAPRPPPVRKPTPHPQPRSAEQRAVRESRSREAYEERLRAAEARREAAEVRQAERGRSTSARPLPVPPAALSH